jgi:hypothetical protein
MHDRRLDLILAMIALAVWSYSGQLRHAIGAEPSDTKSRDAQESVETTHLIKAELPNWKLSRVGDRKIDLKVEPTSVLRWTNPGMGRVYGDLYLWIADGRPEVVMSLFKTWEPAHGFHAEMHSLALTAVEAERDGKIVWQPLKPGVTLQDVPDAAKPAAASQRLSQMRALAREFSAELTDYRRNDAGERQALRLLTQPMYRYQSTDAELLDGAMFAFVLGTDPEVFLLLEARRSKETPRWQFGLARMNNDSLAVSYKDREVWRIKRAEAEYEDRLHAPYILMRVPETK